MQRDLDGLDATESMHHTFLWEELWIAMDCRELPTLLQQFPALTGNRAPLWCEYKQQDSGTAVGIL